MMLLTLLPLAGCRSDPPPRTGFLSGYDKLEEIDRNTYRYLSKDLVKYKVFVIDPVEVRVGEGDSRLSAEQIDQAAAHFTNRLTEQLRAAGFSTLPGKGWPGYPANTLRVRFALTDARSARVLLNLHPGSKLTGAGTGGAAMEGEIVDPATGRQLAAFVQSGRGSQFELDQFNRLDDVKDVIDDWVEDIVVELDTARQSLD